MSNRDTETPRSFYPHVEGLRGVAALYVFVFHIWQTAIQHPVTATLGSWYGATLFLQYGHFAVAAFIVISGFCLGLPVAQRPGQQFDVKKFFIRRARRLMPAYVPVVILSTIPFAATVLLMGGHVNVRNVAIAVGMHLALIHNLFYVSTEYLNGPLWSIALECQIYVVFALILVPVWRRFGLAAQLGVALVLGFLPHAILHTLDWTVPWLVALFAMGLVAADLCARRTLPRLPWSAFALGAAAVSLFLLVPWRDGIGSDVGLWPGDLAVGATIALFFIAARNNERIVPARLLALPPVVFLGTFSYSLYLIHAPIVDVTGALLARAHAGPALSVAIWLALIAGVVTAAYGFYLIFERPFLNPSFRRAVEADLHRVERRDTRLLAVEPAR